MLEIPTTTVVFTARVTHACTPVHLNQLFSTLPKPLYTRNAASTYSCINAANMDDTFNFLNLTLL